jgi:hypothetical protein
MNWSRAVVPSLHHRKEGWFSFCGFCRSQVCNRRSPIWNKDSQFSIAMVVSENRLLLWKIADLYSKSTIGDCKPEIFGTLHRKTIPASIPTGSPGDTFS